MTESLIAVMREAPSDMSHCELTCIGREPIDIAKLHAQHAAYAAVFEEQRHRLGGSGVSVLVLPALEKHPDCMFVEDVAVVVPEIAVLTRPGVASRQGEVQHMAETLARLRDRVAEIAAPGTIDGGDTLVVGKHVFVGASTRTNDEGYAQLRSFLEPFGYTFRRISVAQYGCMHLKCAATAVTSDTVLVRSDATEVHKACAEAGLAVLLADPSEPDAANVLAFTAGDRRVVVVAAAFPKTVAIVRHWAEQRQGVDVRVLAVDEVAKAEGALTCCSLLVYRAAVN